MFWLFKRYTKFEVGQKVNMLMDRKWPWVPENEYEIAEIKPSRLGSIHPKRLIMTTGEEFSGYWFDPKVKVL